MKDSAVLWWPGRLLAEDDLRRHWTSQGEIVLGTKTIVTPLAWDFLRGKRIAIRREDKTSDARVSLWGYAEQSPSPLVAAAIKDVSLARMETRGELIDWMRAIAEQVANGRPAGALVFSEHPALAAWIANKTRGVRAATVCQPAEIKALQKSLGPNVYAVAGGRTFFELRQIVKLATEQAPVCPPELKEADRANR